MGQEPTPTDAGNGQEPEPVQGQAPTTSSEPPADATSVPKDFDEEYVKTLRRSEASARTKLRNAEKRVQELEERDKSEAEKLADRVAQSEKRAQEAETKLVRYEIAKAHNLPPEAVGFLKGSTAEELESSATALSEFIDKNKKSAVPSFDGGTRTTPAETKSPEVAHNEFLARIFGTRAGP
jgi:hypothetical protein